VTALQVFTQQNGEVTSAYYAQLNSCGPAGQVAVALFRAQKRSSRAKDYRPGRYRRAAYDVKSWSIDEACRLLEAHGAELGLVWGWKEDPAVVFDGRTSWVLYVELPQGQVSFHSPDRGKGPAYAGEWDGQHASEGRIIAFCDSIEASSGAFGGLLPIRRTTGAPAAAAVPSSRGGRKPAGNAETEGE
jgi:hypothetical protein